MIRFGSALSRTLALALAVSSVLFILALVVVPLSNWKRDLKAARAAAIDEAQRLTTTIAQLRKEAAEFSGGGIRDIVWPASQLGEVTARIQARIGELAQANELAVRSITPSGEREPALTRVVAFRLELEAELDDLAEFLIASEYHEPILAVERATLRRLARPGPPTEQPLLFVQLDILAPVQMPDGEAE